MMSSYAVPFDYEQPAELARTAPSLIFVPRSPFQFVTFLPALALAGVSWVSDGLPDLTDTAFLMFTILCGFFLTMEFVRFPRRFGIGGMVLYGGCLTWFCQDYFTHWYHHSFINVGTVGFSAVLLAKVTFLHILFVTLMSIGLNIKAGHWAVRLLLCIPDPGDKKFYFYLLIALFSFGLTPYLFFSNENFFLGIWHAATACWTQPPALTAYRDGNLNYNWGAYVAQIMQVGQVSGIIAIMYTLLIADSVLTKLMGAVMWSFYAMVAFQTGRRGEISFTLLPPIAILFIKYQSQAAAYFKKFSLRAYILCGLLTAFMYIVVQIQGTFRGGGLANTDISRLEVFKNQGNTMFSEGMLAYNLVPEKHDFFYSSDFPGEGFFVAIPRTVFDFVVGMIPRALWHDKPIDQLWAWYNLVYTGVGNGISGTTISHGLIGSWYFKYGLGGVIEGGLLVGWLMGVGERTLQESEGRPLGVLISLAFTTWLFRVFRDFIFIDLYPLVLGCICLYILVHVMRPALSDGAQPIGTG
jgi:hypothetical protein